MLSESDVCQLLGLSLCRWSRLFLGLQRTSSWHHEAAVYLQFSGQFPTLLSVARFVGRTDEGQIDIASRLSSFSLLVSSDAVRLPALLAAVAGTSSASASTGEECEVGRCSLDGAVSCAKCDRGMYVSELGMSQRSACGTNQNTLDTGATSESQCECPNGTYMNAGFNAWVTCPEGMLCPGRV